MYQLPIHLLVLYLAQVALLIALVGRLYYARLYRVYPFFFSYIVALLLQSAIISVVPYNGKAYPYVWMVTEAFIVCFHVLIVGELYRVILRDLTGIATVSRRYIQITVVFGILVSLLLFHFEETPASYVSTFLVIERGIAFSLVIFILLGSAFLAYFPVSLNRNVVLYSIGYSIYFLTKATALFIRTLGHYWLPQIGTVLLGVSSACLLFWVLGLNREGERRIVQIGHKWSPENAQRLLSKVREINENLIHIKQAN